jgi:hypothetical protein
MLMMHHDASSRCIIMLMMHRDDEQPEQGWLGTCSILPSYRRILNQLLHRLVQGLDDKASRLSSII